MRSMCLQTEWKTSETENVFLLILVEFPPRVLSTLLIKLADIQRRLAAGCSERPQVVAFVAAFHIARDMVSV